MEEAIIRFRSHLEIRYPERSTAKHYMSDLTIFCRFVGDRPPQAVTAKIIDDFVQWQSGQGLCAATINRRLAALSSCFEFLIGETEHDGWRNPVRWKRHSIRVGRHLPRDVSDETITQLFSVIDDRRDRAIFTLMIGAGLRVGEVVSLRLDNVLDTSAFELVRLRVCGKGDKERIVWLTPEVMHQLQAWLQERPSASSPQLFLNQHQQALSVAGVQFRLKQYCERAGVKCSCHQLRHTFARRLAEHSMPIDSLAKLLGHSSLQTTQGYIDGADPLVRHEFLAAMAQLNQLAAQPAQVVTEPPAVTAFSAAQIDKRPTPAELLGQIMHLAADLPPWLKAEVISHTRRRIPRWSAHRAKDQTRLHFGTLCRICRWLVIQRDWQQLAHLQRVDLAAYVHVRQADGIKPRSMASELTIFRMFWRDLLERDRVTNGAILQVKAPAGGDYLPRYLTVNEFQRLEQVIRTETAGDALHDRFDCAWFYLLAHTGVRHSELRNLRLSDCDLNGKRLRIQAGKGKRDRVIPLTAHLVACLQAYLMVRESAPTDHLLVYRGTAVKAHLIPGRLRRYGQKAGIPAVSPHRLRHTLATLLINQGMPIVSLQKLLGHKDINKTLIYARVHDETLQGQFAAAMDQIESLPVEDWPTGQTATPRHIVSVTQQICDSV